LTAKGGQGLPEFTLGGWGIWRLASGKLYRRSPLRHPCLLGWWSVAPWRKADRVSVSAPLLARQYSLASMIVMTRRVTAGSAGSGEWYVKLRSK